MKSAYPYGKPKNVPPPKMGRQNRVTESYNKLVSELGKYHLTGQLPEGEADKVLDIKYVSEMLVKKGCFTCQTNLGVVGFRLISSGKVIETSGVIGNRRFAYPHKV